MPFRFALLVSLIASAALHAAAPVYVVLWFSWPIHPAGFSAPELLELGRLQAWTLKPARLR
jgi:hypothetical protein